MGDGAGWDVAAVLGLAAAVLAAGVALWNEARRRRHDTRLESARLAAERDAERATAVRVAVAGVFTEMLRLQHEVEWLCWHALHDPESVDDEMIGAYDAAVHATVPRMLGSLAALASLDLEAHERVLPVARTVYAFEGQTALLTVQVRRSGEPERSRAALGEQHAAAERLWEWLPAQLASVLRGEPASTPQEFAERTG